jgi:hypothetical protein
MPIPIPVTKTIINTQQWGIPITNEVNRLSGLHTPIICTRATRPSVKIDGDLIYETDTGALFVWRASISKWRGVRSVQTTISGGGGTTPNANQSPVVVCATTFPDQGCDGRIAVQALAYWSQNVAADKYWIRVKAGASDIGYARMPGGNDGDTCTIVGGFSQLSGVATTIQMTIERYTGTGTATVYNDSTLNLMVVTFTPDT